jgi:hypothetical protein
VSFDLRIYFYRELKQELTYSYHVLLLVPTYSYRGLLLVLAYYPWHVLLKVMCHFVPQVPPGFSFLIHEHLKLQQELDVTLEPTFFFPFSRLNYFATTHDSSSC